MCWKSGHLWRGKNENREQTEEVRQLKEKQMQTATVTALKDTAQVV